MSHAENMRNVCLVTLFKVKGIFKPFVKAIDKLFDAELFLVINRSVTVVNFNVRI